MIQHVTYFLVLPFYKRGAHTWCNRGWIGFVKFKNTLDTSNFCWSCVHTAKSSPIIYNHTSSNHITTSVHCSCLNAIFHLKIKNMRQIIYICLTASGTCKRDDSSSCSCIDILGWTNPPWLDKMEYDPTKTLLATVCLNTSTFRVSAKISSVSYD